MENEIKKIVIVIIIFILLTIGIVYLGGIIIKKDSNIQLKNVVLPIKKAMPTKKQKIHP